MKQLLVDAQALRAAELHIPVEEQVEVVEALGDNWAQLRRQGLEVALEVHAVVVEDLLDVVALVGVAQQVVGGHFEVPRQKADRFKVGLLALGLIARDSGALFLDEPGQILLGHSPLLAQGDKTGGKLLHCSTSMKFYYTCHAPFCVAIAPKIGNHG